MKPFTPYVWCLVISFFFSVFLRGYCGEKGNYKWLVQLHVKTNKDNSFNFKWIQHKHYGLSDHLSSQRVTILNLKYSSLQNSIVSILNYYPFGASLLTSSQLIATDYGFNNQTIDHSLYGAYNSYDFGARFYNPRTGRFMKSDRLEYLYPSLSSYQYVNNNPINNIDINGDYIYIINDKEPIDVNDVIDQKTKGIKSQKLTKIEIAVIQFGATEKGKSILDYGLDNPDKHLYVYPEIDGSDPTKYTLTPIYMLESRAARPRKTVNESVHAIADLPYEIEEESFISYQSLKENFGDEVQLVTKDFAKEFYETYLEGGLTPEIVALYKIFESNDAMQHKWSGLHDVILSKGRLWNNTDELKEWYEEAFNEHIRFMGFYDGDFTMKDPDEGILNMPEILQGGVF